MQRRQRIVFGNMGMPREEKIQGPSDDPVYLHNTLILEIANNWPWVRWMMDRARHQELKHVDPMERDWLNFILQNHIDVEKYGKDSDQFVEEWFKNKK
jgi:hypothetical protein